MDRSLPPGRSSWQEGGEDFIDHRPPFQQSNNDLSWIDQVVHLLLVQGLNLRTFLTPHICFVCENTVNWIIFTTVLFEITHIDQAVLDDFESTDVNFERWRRLYMYLFQQDWVQELCICLKRSGNERIIKKIIIWANEIPTESRGTGGRPSWYMRLMGATSYIEERNRKLKFCRNSFTTLSNLKEVEIGDLIEIERKVTMLLPYSHFGFIESIIIEDDDEKSGKVDYVVIHFVQTDSTHGTYLRERLSDVVDGCPVRVNNLAQSATQRGYVPYETSVSIYIAGRKVGHRKRYNNVDFNCEHAATKIKYGQKFSEQSETLKRSKMVEFLARRSNAMGYGSCSGSTSNQQLSTSNSQSARNEKEQKSRKGKGP